MTSEQARLIVYYDGGCPMCRREIAFYRRRDADQAIAWRDIDASPLDPIRDGLDQVTAMARMHVRRVDGSLASGALAFLALYRALPAPFNVIGQILSVPPLPWLLERAYRMSLVVRPWLTGRRANSSRCTPKR